MDPADFVATCMDDSTAEDRVSRVLEDSLVLCCYASFMAPLSHHHSAAVRLQMVVAVGGVLAR